MTAVNLKTLLNKANKNNNAIARMPPINSFQNQRT